MQSKPQRWTKDQIRNLRSGLPHLYGWKWYAWARAFFETTNRQAFLCAANQVSKALDDDTIIPTPFGSKRIGDIRVGDRVFGADGSVRRVIGVPFRGEAECFSVVFDDGSSVVASGDHLWSCKTSKERFRREYSSLSKVWENPEYDMLVLKTTSEIILSGKYGGGRGRPWDRVSIPVCRPVSYAGLNLFDPYLVGLLLGDGGLTSRSVILTNPEQEIIDYVVTKYGAKRVGKIGFRLNGLQPEMRSLGLLGKKSKDKFIPREYLRGSVEQRLSLLRGLMDTDGTVSRSSISYCTTSPQLSRDFVELVNSLGGKASVKKRAAGYRDKSGEYVKCNDAYNIRINILICPFSLPRKASKFFISFRRHERVIYKIEPVGRRRATCITVSGDGTFLCTGNYIVTHNSSTQIRKVIELSGNPAVWPKFWATRPKQFWYLYPSREMALSEFKTKWMDFMPAGEFKNHPTYGWKEMYGDRRSDLKGIEWNSGVFLYFKTYSQDSQHLQAGSCHYIACDEELPIELYDELMLRMAATDGHFSMAFTATLNQDFWRMVIEGKGEAERLPDAFKQQISMYDCLAFDDGSPGVYSEEKIARIKAQCRSESEIQRRVYGRFVKEIGLKYPQFDALRHYKKPFSIPLEWRRHAGVDIGSGGPVNHPPAIVFLAIRPDGRLGVVYRAWRGDDGAVYSNGDILNKFVELRGDEPIVSQVYDWNAKDFGTISERSGEPFMPAEKSHERGEGVINTLFKNDMLFLFSDSDEIEKLGGELSTLMKETAKAKAKDDLSDAFRYAVMSVAWDWSALRGDMSEIQVMEERARPLTDKERIAMEIAERRGEFVDINGPKNDGWEELDAEFDFWNGRYAG